MFAAELFVPVPLESHDLLHHLIIDKLIKIGIVIGALMVITIGMVVIWRRSDPRRRREPRD